MSKLLNSNNAIHFVNEGTISDTLPPGNYLLKHNDDTGEYFLHPKSAFNIPDKLYGNYSQEIARWKKSWESDTTPNLGILLSGIKGSGKTILCKQFCLEMNMPVIMIGESYSDSGLLDFLSDPCLSNAIIFIDEYDKIKQDSDSYNDSNGFERNMLSMMDGNFKNRMIFLLTVNEENAISEYMYNRLNRIKYYKKFQNLDTETVNDVIKDKLRNQEFAKSIHSFFAEIGIITFDLLINIINECNLFNEDALTCGRHLNLRAEENYYTFYEMYNGEKYKCRNEMYSTNFRNEISIYRNKTVVNEYKRSRSKSPMNGKSIKVLADGGQIVDEYIDDERIDTMDMKYNNIIEVSKDQYTVERQSASIIIKINDTDLVFIAEPYFHESVF